MLLTAAEIAAMPAERRVHFLNPTAIRANKSLGDATGLTQLGVHLITVAPGDFSTEYHAHHFEEECIYVLSGTGVATIDGVTHPIGPGDFIGCPINGKPHEMLNNGTVPLVCLVVGQRLVQDIADYPRRGKRLYRHAGAWDVVEHTAIQHLKR